MIKNRGRLAWLIYLAVPMSGAGIDIFVPSLPSMAESFSASPSAVSMTIPVYLLAYGVAQPVVGSLSDSYGRRFLMLLGVSLYLIGSLLAAQAPSLAWLLAARALQGIGVAGPAVLTKAVLTDAFSGEERMQMANTMTIAWAVGPILSPVLGGYLEAAFGWTSSFLFLGAYSALVLLLCGLFWPETIPHRVPFQFQALRAAYQKILSEPRFLLIVVQMALLYSLMTSFHVIGPFLIQNQLGYSPVTFGKVALLLGIGWFTGNVLCNLLARVMPRERVTLLGLSLALVVVSGMVIVSFSSPLSLWSLIGPAFALFLVGGAVFPNLMGRALALFPEAAGTAGALTGAILVLGAAFSSSLATQIPAESARGLSLAYFFLVLSMLVLTFWLNRLKQNFKLGLDGDEQVR